MINRHILIRTFILSLLLVFIPFHMADARGGRGGGGRGGGGFSRGGGSGMGSIRNSGSYGSRSQGSYSSNRQSSWSDSRSDIARVRGERERRATGRIAAPNVRVTGKRTRESVRKPAVIAGKRILIKGRSGVKITMVTT